MLLWSGGLAVLPVGAALLIVFLGNTGHSNATPIVPGGQIDRSPKSVPLAGDVRRVAGLFINTAVARRNLARSWDLVTPELRGGMTKQEWLTGEIPVVPFPEVGQARFKTDLSYDEYALLEVALLPKANDVNPQLFFIELKKLRGSWLVNSWAPRSTVARPSTS